MQPERAVVDVVIVGAGPCGLAAAISAQRAGLSVAVIERECIVSGIASYPTYMTFFSTAPKHAIGNVPFIVATEKPTRRDALAYYRAVAEHYALDIRQYETVVEIQPIAEAAGSEVRSEKGESVESGGGRGSVGPSVGEPAVAKVANRTGGPPPNSNVPSSTATAVIGSPQLASRYRVRSMSRAAGERVTDAHAVVIATGYFGSPNKLDVPGESLPHVTHLYRDGHEAFRQDAVVVGGGNSAVEAALDLHRCGARVTLVHFGPSFDRNIKPWVLPTMEARLTSGEINVRWNATVQRIEPDAAVLRTEAGVESIPASHVFLMLGYMPEVGLLRDLGVPIEDETGIPRHDPATMETLVPGVFIAGVIASGYDANKTFIENGRYHGDLIVRRLLGAGDVAANPSPS